MCHHNILDRNATLSDSMIYQLLHKRSYQTRHPSQTVIDVRSQMLQLAIALTAVTGFALNTWRLSCTLYIYFCYCSQNVMQYTFATFAIVILLGWAHSFLATS